MTFREIDPNEYTGQPFAELGKNWALLSAGKEDAFNSMTVSWGAVGELWGKHVVFVFVRPQRYTYEFCEKNEYMSLSIMPDGYQKELAVFGRKSGRDCDKYAETGLTAAFTDHTAYCAEAHSVFELKKIAAFDFDPNTFIDASIVPDCYPNKDFHRVYVGEITRLLVKE